MRDDGEMGTMGVPLVHDASLTPSEEKRERLRQRSFLGWCAVEGRFRFCLSAVQVGGALSLLHSVTGQVQPVGNWLQHKH